MGLSILIRCKYGLVPAAQVGTILSSIDGGAHGLEGGEAAGVRSSEVIPGGGDGGRDEL